MSKPKFNREQQMAIDASSKVNLLISAGAGSGKTKTLSERVYRLIESGEIKPSELLVLTFTNNAAHEMKERIIARFQEANSPLAEEMPSAHIQTFDSFSQYLVSTYAGALGLSHQISIANESVMEAKKAELFDQVMATYYEDPALRERLLATFPKFATRDEKRIKTIILDLDRQLEKMLPSQKEAFLKEYDERYLSDEACRGFFGEFIESQKQIIRETLYESYFIERHYEEVFGERRSPESLKTAFGDARLFQKDIRTFLFDDKVYCQSMYEAALALLDLEGMDFIQAVQAFEIVHADIGKSVSKKNLADPDSEAKVKAVWGPLHYLFFTLDAKLIEAKSFAASEAEAFGLIRSFKEDIHLFLDIVIQLENALLDYKKSINAFTFADISSFALTLLSDPKYEDIAREIRARFKYIMVDEYQDTNDFQELFINSLLCPDEAGEAAHLFCVGDAKQSIYAFRNSNVELFRARQRSYEDSEAGQVIHMNRNYRSGKALLSQINYIFQRYMTLENGSIDYADPKEQLTYDDEVDIYGKPYDHFGIYRILSPRPIQKGERLDYEIHTIIDTISKMVEEGYPVYDRSIGGIRPCAYKDFAILTRNKTKFPWFQSAFNQAGIPLNISVTTNLREIDAIILLQSLLSLVAWKLEGIPVDVKHLFASVARSYAYGYSDEKIYDLISYVPKEGEEELRAIFEDPIMVALDGFCREHEHSSLNTIFLDLLSSFHVMDRLYLLGDIEGNIAKIESLHQMVLSEEKAGEGLKEFVALFASIRKYELDLKVDNDTEVENSVDLMTIHASKGLERKIIFLPSSQNLLSIGSSFNKPDYAFSTRYGMLLPNYCLSEGQDRGSVYSLPYRLYLSHQKDSDPEMDEHVRVLYVALTRAENAIYIVGDDPKRKGSLYEMLGTVPHYFAFHPELVKEKLASGILQQKDYEAYLRNVDFTQNGAVPLSEEELGKDAYKIYQTLGKAYFKSNETKELDQLITKMKVDLYTDYHKQALAKKDDFDFLCRLYGAYAFPQRSIQNKDDLVAAFIIEGQVSCDEEPKTFALLGKPRPPKKQASAFATPSEAEIITGVRRFGKALFEEDVTFFGLKKPKDDSDIPSVMAQAVLDLYAYVFDGYDHVGRISYASTSYPDTVIPHTWNKQEKTGVFHLHIRDLQGNQINDDEIAFPIRERKRASKKNVPSDEDTPVKSFLGRGARLHRLMELVDWQSRDLSFIPNAKDRQLVEHVINLPLFQKLEGGKFLPEYGYYDADLKTTGFIDLLVIKDGIYTIIDWKTKNIDDEAYEDQLHTYQRNIERIFGVSKDQIRLVLVSLVDQEVKTVEAE